MSQSFFGAIIFIALTFCFPASVKATTIPNTLNLVTLDTVQVVEKNQFTHWFRLGQKTHYDPLATREIEMPKTRCVDFPFFCQGFVPRTILNHFINQPSLTINREQATQDLISLFEELERDPINAKLGMDEEKKLIIVAEAVPGLQIEPEKNIDTVLAALEKNQAADLRIELVAEATPAKVSRDTIEALGIHDLIAEGKTNFRGSPKNRIFNIHRAVQQYDGIVIPAGEEFSFVDFLGEVDGEHGYLPELVIKNNKTEPEFGGGICQVSTTIFRAAIYAGLEIIERKNHSYPVQYYKPYGMDATIYIPRPDLKFKNNTPGAILVLPSIIGTELTFSFYGTKDGRTTTVDGPHILESNPDGSMRTIFTQTVKDKDGTTFINATFPSNYKSPSLFPHPGEEILTEKPKNWSGRQWKEYKAIHP